MMARGADKEDWVGEAEEERGGGGRRREEEGGGNVKP